LIKLSKPEFNGSIAFFDPDNYLLCGVDLHREQVGLRFAHFMGCNFSEQHVGNISSNMAQLLEKPIFLEKYEHFNHLFHEYIGYSEPVYLKKKKMGILTVAKLASGNREEDKRSIYNLLRLLLQSSLEIGSLKGFGKVEFKSQNPNFLAKNTFDDIKTKSLALREVIKKAKTLSRFDNPIILYGESGTGKELFANAIHNASPRANKPFVSLNCASLSQSLLESELFGYSGGAFTGAYERGKKGKIELAHNGTLFLDEIENLSMSAQAMLLRVLQENEFIKVGDEKITKVNIRIICATNHKMRDLCEEKAFRWDLYYRLAGIELALPPLRERKADIALLCRNYLDQATQKRGINKNLPPEALELLVHYHWPGNVRELYNILESAWILSPGDVINKRVVAELINYYGAKTSASREVKKAKLLETLASCNGNIKLAAKSLNISRATAYRWLSEYVKSDKF
jgi:transcriptional regulator with PAS, ATPase and Fis domain